MAQVINLLQSMYRKINLELDFHNNVLVYIYTTVTCGVVFCAGAFNLKS